MLPALFVAAGAVYFLLRDRKAKYPHNMYDCATGQKYVAKTEADHQRMADLGYVHNMNECMIDPPVADDDQFDDMDEETIEEVWSNEDDTVKVFKVGFLMGLRYDNGVDERYYRYVYVIGNNIGSSFVTYSSDRGTETVQGISRVAVFSTKEEAISEATKEDDDSGGSPQKPDEPYTPPPSSGRPSIPSLGVTQLSPSFGGM